MSIKISYESDTELGVDNYENIIEEVIEAGLDSLACPYEVEVNISLVNEEDIHEINKAFREIDRATDVLSFPAIEWEKAGDFEGMQETFDTMAGLYFNPDSGELILGDMMLSVPRLINQASEYGHSRKRELAFLIAHSLFHLCGFDHMEPEEARDMEKRQEELLEKLAIRRD